MTPHAQFARADAADQSRQAAAVDAYYADEEPDSGFDVPEPKPWQPLDYLSEWPDREVER